MEVERSTEGYLVNVADWTPDIAEWLAASDGIQLTEAHWQVIQLVRDFYLIHERSLPIRALVNAMKKHYGPEKGNSLYLQSLFPKGAAKQVAKIAGLPKPTKCT